MTANFTIFNVKIQLIQFAQQLITFDWNYHRTFPFLYEILCHYTNLQSET